MIEPTRRTIWRGAFACQSVNKMQECKNQDFPESNMIMINGKFYTYEYFDMFREKEINPIYIKRYIKRKYIKSELD